MNHKPAESILYPGHWFWVDRRCLINRYHTAPYILEGPVYDRLRRGQWEENNQTYYCSEQDALDALKLATQPERCNGD